MVLNLRTNGIAINFTNKVLLLFSLRTKWYCYINGIANKFKKKKSIAIKFRKNYAVLILIKCVTSNDYIATYVDAKTALARIKVTDLYKKALLIIYINLFKRCTDYCFR